MPSLIPGSAWARRFVYELVYAWPGAWRTKAFNIGIAPVDAAILADADLAGDGWQVQLYAELFSMAGLDAETWHRSAVIDVAAGCGGGLLYLSKRYRPRMAVGIDVSSVAVRRGRRSGIDLRRADATNLPFEDGSFDCLVCVDALNYFVEAEFVREAVRVLRPSGRVLLAEVSTSFTEAEARFRRMAQRGGLLVDALRNVSEGARGSLHERASLASKALAWVPAPLRRRVGEMLILEGSERFRRWQDGEQCLAMVALTKPGEGARKRESATARRESAYSSCFGGGSPQGRAG